MSIRPSGSRSPSMGCSRSASHAPPVYSPIIALAGVTRARNSSTSGCSRSSASGSAFIEILLEDQLRGDRIDRQLRGTAAAQALRCLDRGVALVHQLDRQAEAATQLGRAYRYADTLDAEVEGEDRAGDRFRHVPPRPRAAQSRARAVPSPPASALRRADRR